MAKRVWMPIAVVAVVGAATGGLTLLAMMANETHVERPSAHFDAFTRQMEALPGVDVVGRERWVEAPSFSDPTSWVSVTVDEAGLPGLLAAACAADYADPVTWSIRVRTSASAEVSLPAGPPKVASAVAGASCPSFDFDAAGLIETLDRVAPGLGVQPTIWHEGTLTLVALDDAGPDGFTHLLPLIEHAEALITAAGLDPEDAIEINSRTLGVRVHPTETGAYLDLLTELSEEHGVTSYWADSGTAQTDGIAKVQVVAPKKQHAAITQVIRSSGLPTADLPVRFLGP